MPGLCVGDLILADSVCDVETGFATDVPTVPCAAAQWRRGRLLTVASLVGRPEEKGRLAERSGAVAVDMESAVVARMCHAAGVPFACLRVISDDVDTPLSKALLDLVGAGRVRVGRLAGAVLRRPGLIAELIRLASHTRTAARRLAEGLEEFLNSSSR
ncbi:MAG TPA: hypothetical protein VMS17_00465 [Gemmataceae bacterium]|nr:hypothetical protein [Gemmataceae bacterium]